MARASAAREEALELNHMLLQRLRELNQNRRSASREELMNAMLHYFSAVGVDDDELGDLSLERMPRPIGPAEEGPVPIHNSRSKYTALVLNLGSFARNRKRTAPSLFSDIIDYDDSGESVGLLLKSIAHAKAHLFLLCEAAELNDRELDFLHRRGWETKRNPNGELLVGFRTNGQGSTMTMLAGSTLVGVAHSHLPLTYMIVDIKLGKTLPHGSQGSQTMRKHVHRLPVLSGGSHWGRPQHGPLQVLRYQTGFDGHTGRDVSKHPYVLFGRMGTITAQYAVLHTASAALQSKQPFAP